MKLIHVRFNLKSYVKFKNTERKTRIFFLRLLSYHENESDIPVVYTVYHFILFPRKFFMGKHFTDATQDKNIALLADLLLKTSYFFFVYQVLKDHIDLPERSTSGNTISESRKLLEYLLIMLFFEQNKFS